MSIVLPIDAVPSHRHFWRLKRPPHKHFQMYRFVCDCGESTLKYKFGFWLPSVVSSKFEGRAY